MGTGGMRYGAGRPSYKVKAEQVHRVDIREWSRRGYLREGCRFSWSWHRGEEPSGSISVHVHSAYALTLQYRFTVNEVAQDIADIVRISLTACRYGGNRPWFSCLRCGRRVAVLYMRGGRFGCRICQRIAYSSQSDDLLDGLWRKQAKIEKRLGENWQRPKGMRQRTYDGLKDKLCELEGRREGEFAAYVSRLFSITKR
jgi:hypothetical protein